MQFRTPLIAASLLIATPQQGLASDGGFDALGLQQIIQETVTQVVLSFVRGAVEMTYDGLAIDPRSGDLAIEGLTFRPQLDWDTSRSCVIRIDTVSAAGGGIMSSETLMTVYGLSVPASCIDPAEGGAMLPAFGFDAINAEAMTIEIAYDFPSSATSLLVAASVEKVGEVTLTADFDYFWVQGVQPGEDEPDMDDVKPVAILREAELSIENGGVLEAVEPMLAQQIGDPSAIPAMAQAGLTAALSREGTRTPTPDELAFVQNVSEELGRFVEARDRIVLTAQPDTPVRLTEETFADPAEIIAALQPRVSAQPAARSRVIAPELLSKAMAAAEGDGTLSDAERLTVGQALITGEGAPRARALGETLLTESAEAGNAEAALLIAQSKADSGDAASAYALALRAQAGDLGGATALADRLEAELGLAQIIEAQSATAQPVDGTALKEAGDVGGMRALATAFAIGSGRSRNYEQALYWATLASAGGDRAAAALVNRLDRRFTADPDEARDWALLTAEVSDRAFSDWVSAGIAAKVAGGN